VASLQHSRRVAPTRPLGGMPLVAIISKSVFFLFSLLLLLWSDGDAKAALKQLSALSVTLNSDWSPRGTDYRNAVPQ
jgi:hypothetical protein